MSDIIATGTSNYATGGIDTATILVNNVSPRDAKHPNGCADAIVQIENVLGTSTSLRGILPDLATRLANVLNNVGQFLLTGFTGLTIDRGLLAISSTQMAVVNHTPIGIIQPYAGTSAPAHWLLCDGSAVDRTQYSKLFNVTSTIYGSGNGSTTFNVPDLRGRTPIGLDGGVGRITVTSLGGGNANTLGGTGGADIHTLLDTEVAAHTHHQHTKEGTLGDASASGILTGSNNIDSTSTKPDTDVTGSNAPHSNTQPWIALNYIIFAAV